MPGQPIGTLAAWQSAVKWWSELMASHALGSSSQILQLAGWPGRHTQHTAGLAGGSGRSIGAGPVDSLDSSGMGAGQGSGSWGQHAQRATVRRLVRIRMARTLPGQGPPVYGAGVTTWYRRPRDPKALAYSVRPDLWPAGSRAQVSQLLDTRIVYLATAGGTDWALPAWAAEAELYSGPGVAEALILAGQVSVVAHAAYGWVEVVP